MIEWYIIVSISLFVIVTFMVLRKKTHKHDETEEEEERWAESLTDEDVQDLYGDKEERWKGDDD
ncbi:MAG: hypothetical protein ABI579_01820 [Candidatus Sumerlaeota bacterium]